MIYVFLDTNIYIKGHGGKELIDPSQDYFPHLVRHAKNGRLQLVMPTVTKAEIEAHIRIAANRCREAFNALTLPQPSVELTPLITKLQKEYDAAATAEQIRLQYEQFWNNTNCTVLSITQIDTEKIVRARYENKPPFTGKKHDEYQDAFVLQALEEFRKTNMSGDDALVVISADDAFRAYVQALDPDIPVFRGLHGLFDMWGKTNQAMLDLLNEGIHELELEQHILDELDGFDITLTNEGELLAYDTMDAAFRTEPETGKPIMRITGYEVMDEGSALLSFEAETEITLTGVEIPEFLYNADGDVCDVSLRTADVTKTVLLTGWTDIWGKFDAEDNIEFVEDVNDLEFDNETGSMVIDLSDGDLEINYYDT